MVFGKAIQAGDLATAGRHLGTLMDLSEKDGLAAAKFFQERTQKDPETTPKTMQLRGAIAEGKTNEAMARLIECFGLDGLRAVTAVEAMRRMLVGGPHLRNHLKAAVAIRHESQAPFFVFCSLIQIVARTA